MDYKRNKNGQIVLVRKKITYFVMGWKRKNIKGDELYNGGSENKAYKTYADNISNYNHLTLIKFRGGFYLETICDYHKF